MRRSTSQKERESLTILLIPHSAAATRKISISRTAVFIAGTAAALTICCLVFLGVQYYSSLNDRQALQQAKQSNAEMKADLELLSVQLMQIQEQTQELDQKQTKIKKMMGVNTAAASVKPAPTPSRGGWVRLGRTSDSQATALLARARAMNTLLNLKQAETNRLLDMATERAQALRALPNLWPLYGRLTSTFGYRQSPFSRRKSEFHDGIDIAAPSGTKIRAAGDGIVVGAGWESGFGRLVRVSHGNGYETWYGHNSRILVKKGDHVRKGEAISLVGSSGRSTGPHLHFKVLKNGQDVNPMRVLP